MSSDRDAVDKEFEAWCGDGSDEARHVADGRVDAAYIVRQERSGFRAGAEWMRAEAAKAIEAERFRNLHRRDMKARVVRIIQSLGTPLRPAQEEREEEGEEENA